MSINALNDYKSTINDDFKVAEKYKKQVNHKIRQMEISISETQLPNLQK